MTQLPKHFLGIDLGTTNSVISVAYPGLGRKHLLVQSVPIEQVDGNHRTVEKQILPSVLYVETPEDAYVGEFAREQRKNQWDKTVSSVKLQMGKKWTQQVGGVELDAPLVSAHYLRHLRKQAERHLGLPDKTIKGAVICVPASFDNDARADTIKAAMLADFEQDQVILLDEPRAALLSFLNQQATLPADQQRLNFDHPKKLLVYDLGGGTLDVTIMEVKNDARSEIGMDIQSIAISRFTDVGGNLFDLAVARHLLKELQTQNNVRFQSLDEHTRKYLIHALMVEAEQIKIFLSSRLMNRQMNDGDIEKVVWPLDLLLMNKYRIKLDVNKRLYDEITAPLFDPVEKYNIISPLMETLEEAGLKPSDIDEVFLVGGMTRFPTVQETIRSIFGREPLRMLSPDLAVAEGAAIYHFYRTTYQEMAGVDPLAESVFIEAYGRPPVEIVPKGVRLPFEKTFEGFFEVTASWGLDIRLMRAKSWDDPKMATLQQRKALFDTPQLKGTPLTLHVSVNTNKELFLKVWLADHPEKAFEVEVPNVNITKEQLEELRRRMVANINREVPRVGLA